ncbi:MAG: alcohol dehydrogenase catalytic domain-containing protein [Pseudomonadota bacterium]
MKTNAIVISDGKPDYVQTDIDESTGVTVKVVSSSICGSDLHLMGLRWLEGQTPGHEFAGIAPNGKAVAVEPVIGCGRCHYCDDGHLSHCKHGAQYLGVMRAGGMAEHVIVPAERLVELPSGLDLREACLVEPVAIALWGLDRFAEAAKRQSRCLVIGAGPIGLAAAAACVSRGLKCDILARYEHQQVASSRLGANPYTDAKDLGLYGMVVDAIGSTESMRQAVQSCEPMASISLLGTPWNGVEFDQGLQMKEINVLPATGYKCASPARTFDEAARLLLEQPELSKAMISHRFPLEAGVEAFDTAANRSNGAIKVAFEMPV